MECFAYSEWVRRLSAGNQWLVARRAPPGNRDAAEGIWVCDPEWRRMRRLATGRWFGAGWANLDDRRTPLTPLAGSARVGRRLVARRTRSTHEV